MAVGEQHINSPVIISPQIPPAGVILHVRIYEDVVLISQETVRECLSPDKLLLHRDSPDLFRILFDGTISGEFTHP